MTAKKVRRKASEWHAPTVVAALQKSMFSEPAHAWLYEVRNRTGWARVERYADALVVSCWPSRGIWMAGVEVKVQRSDWVRELKDPGKSAEIQRFCDYWWVAAPEGVVEPGEVPEQWGYAEVTKRRVRTIKDAPRLEREEWTPEFIASILRNQARVSDSLRRAARDEGYRAAADEFGDEKVGVLQEQLREAERKVTIAEREMDRLRSWVTTFERVVGVDLDAPKKGHGYHFNGVNAVEVGRAFKLARALVGRDYVGLPNRLRGTSENTQALADLIESLVKVES